MANYTESYAGKISRKLLKKQRIIAVAAGREKADLRLEIAGLMSGDTLINVNEKLERAKEAAHSLGVNRGTDPFMTLSFMALPVIPTLRLTTRGVVDVLTQQYI